MINVNDVVLVNKKFMATVTHIDTVDKSIIFEDGKRYFVEYNDGVGADYMSSTSLEVKNVN